jgi:hypothetical protein
MESLLVKEVVLSRQTGITAKKSHNFDPTDGLRLNIYSSFRRPFPWTTYGIPTSGRGGLVEPDRNNS